MNLNPIDAFTALIKGTGGAVTNVAKVFKGSKLDRDQQAHDQFTSTQRSFSAEFNNRNNRTWWDSFWDGLNRMPRPVMVVLVLVYFMLSYFNQIEFQKINLSLDTVPENMWFILGSIIAFYFGSRHFQKKHESLAMTKDQFSETQRRIAELDGKVKVITPVKESLPLWYKLARIEMDKNTKEIYGNKANHEILKYHTATKLQANSDEVAWCSAFVNWCVKTSGNVGTNMANAQSFLKWGTVVDEPKEGDIVVFKRGSEKWMGHVGFFVRMDGNQVMCLGGNQGNEVNITGYDKARVMGYRR